MLLNDASVVFCMIVSAQQSPLTKGQKKEIKQVPSAAKSQTIQINKRNTQQLRIIQQIQHGNLGAKDLNTLLHSDTDSVICKGARVTVLLAIITTHQVHANNAEYVRKKMNRVNHPKTCLIRKSRLQTTV